MRFKEINIRFTEKVNEYLAKGYVFNTASMAGHQGEIAKVDLTDGGYVVRIRLEKKYVYEDMGCGSFGFDAVILTVGVASQFDARPHSSSTWVTIWNEKCNEIFREVFYNVDRNGKEWYVGREEAISAYAKARRRYKDRNVRSKKASGDAVLVALKYVRRQPRCSRAKAGDVRIEKSDVSHRYSIRYRDRVWELR